MLCQQRFCLLVYTPMTCHAMVLCLVSFPLLSEPVGLAHFMHAVVSICLSVQHSKAHASSNLSLLCLPSLLILVLWPCFFFYVYSSVSNFLSFDSVTLFGFYRSSLSRALLVLNDADVLDFMCSFSISFKQ